MQTFQSCNFKICSLFFFTFRYRNNTVFKYIKTLLFYYAQTPDWVEDENPPTWPSTPILALPSCVSSLLHIGAHTLFPNVSFPFYSLSPPSGHLPSIHLPPHWNRPFCPCLDVSCRCLLPVEINALLYLLILTVLCSTDCLLVHSIPGMIFVAVWMKTVPQRLRHLNTWSPLGDTVWGGVSLLEEVVTVSGLGELHSLTPLYFSP